VALIPAREKLGSRQLSPSSEQSHMERSLISDRHPIDVQDLRRGVSIGGLGNHALNFLWRVTGQASDGQCLPSSLTLVHHAHWLPGSPLHGKQAQNRSRRCQVSDRRLSSAVSMVSLQFERANRNDIAISMDGKGAWRDNVFVERLWRSIKYEEVYLRAYDSVGEARQSIGRYLDFYNGRRPHSSLDGMTPDQAYFTQLPIPMAA
jgi:transposase InsO family protein